MCEPHESVEAFLKHVKTETEELAEQLLDASERRRLWATVAAALMTKVLERLPELEIRDVDDAEMLTDEARALLNEAREGLRQVARDREWGRPLADPDLN